MQKMRMFANNRQGLIPALMSVLIIGGLFEPSISLATNSICEPGSGKVARAMFTTTINDREPTNRVLILENNTTKLYFFSDLRHLQGRTITHRWEYEGHVVDEKSFQVNGARWRIYSRHKMDPTMLGRWTAVVTDEDGCPLKAVIFQYVEAGQGPGSAIIDLN